jgi:RNA polymerase sigma-70 factor, ECF subfamily
MSDEEAAVPGHAPAPIPDRAATASDDALILAALAAGAREQAASLLVAQHGLAVGRVCMALLGSQSDAEGALQETLQAALDGLPSSCAEGALRACLLGMARRRCARRLETSAREKLRQNHGPVARLPGADRLSLAERARRLLDDVRPTEREALVLRFTAELSFRELGHACEIDEASAQKRVARGLARLRVLLGEGKT